MVTTLLALDVMENGCIAAPEEDASMGGMEPKEAYTSRKNEWLQYHEEYTVGDKHLCCELLTLTVTGVEPDQVVLCQAVEDLIRIQGAGHQSASTINYRGMRRGSSSAMLKTKEGIFRHRIVIMQCTRCLA